MQSLCIEEYTIFQDGTRSSLWKFADASEVHTATIFKVEYYGRDKEEANGSLESLFIAGLAYLQPRRWRHQSLRSSKMSVNFYLTTRSHIPEVLFIVTAVGTSALSYWYKFCVSCWYFMIRNGKACIGLPAIRSSRVMLGRLYAIVLEMKHSRGRFKYFACVLLLEDKVTNVNTFRVKKLARQPTA